ncbi:MAG: acetyl-CoA carboxylase carboxyltransferase subunit beta [Syntrophomonadaceae bacterium]|nr:acetyl-CoA carboxylase carboxyltransferase subunit beta [Syntrophomonadaceae bacterium]
MLKDVLNLKSKTKYATLTSRSDSYRTDDNTVSDGCSRCGMKFVEDDPAHILMVCSDCGHHQSLSARERIRLLTDEESFIEYDADLISVDPLSFPGYAEKLERAQKETGLKEAIITGKASINSVEFVIGVMDSRFMMASMGSVVGEKVTRAFEKALEQRLPVVMFTASGGARMQEGMLSLMQMAKTSAAVQRFSEEGLFYLSVLTHPTTGGVTASFATLADVIIAEPGATVGFLGAKVIEQTIRQKLPPGFQKSEFVIDCGMIDRIVDRREMREFVGKMLFLHRR